MIVIYLLTLFLLGVYSYSQIDLNLTLFSAPWFLTFQKTMIQLGYFNRPLSTAIFVILVGLLFVWYFFALRQKPASWKVLAVICLIGLVSYPAFSHDIFNYLFDAKILTFYHQNPYLFKALDFPSDPWLRFMHWVHRTYPYGPVWLLVTAPLFFLGFGKFVLTLVSFKLFFIATYLGNIWLIKKIAPKAVTLFALNPLVITESLISPHIDAFMTLLLLAAIYFWQQNDKVKAIIALVLSGGTKFLTFLVIPFLGRLKLAIFVLLLATAVVISQRGPYPWYFLPIIALTSLVGWSRFGFFLSLGALLTYAPYLFVGSYPGEVLTWQFAVLLGPLVLFLLWRKPNWV